MANRMFSLPVTRLNVFDQLLGDLLGRRAPMRCTGEISSSTRVSVPSRSRVCSSASGRVNLSDSG